MNIIGTQNRNKFGFTLLELMIASAVLIVALVGLIAVYTSCLALNETARNITITINSCQEKLEEIRNGSFSQIFTNYNGATFEILELPDVDSEGIVEVNNTNPDLLRVTVTLCWRGKGGRVFGEDANLNGVFSVGTEDANGNGQLDSPAQLVTLIAR